MKTKEELEALKEEVKTLNAKLAKLTKDELQQVAGGTSTLIDHGESTDHPDGSTPGFR